MTEPTKQQQRERAERRRKLEEFWRWVLGEKPYFEAVDEASDLLPALCRDAVDWANTTIPGGLPQEDYRDLSLAQLDVLEMLKDRVGSSTVSIDLGLSDTEQEEFMAIKSFTYDTRKDPFFHPEVAVDSADSDGTLHPWEFK